MCPAEVPIRMLLNQFVPLSFPNVHPITVGLGSGKGLISKCEFFEKLGKHVMWNLTKINVHASSLTRHLLVIVTLCEGPAIGARIKVPASSSRVCR